MTDNSNDHNDDNKPITFFEMMGSVFGALVGIQSQAKRERDFKRMKPHHILVAGILLMLVFFTIVIVITRTLLATH